MTLWHKRAAVATPRTCPVWWCVCGHYIESYHQDQDGRISYGEFQLMVTPPKIDINDEMINIKPKDSAKKVTIVDNNENHKANESDQIKTVKNET